MITHQKEIELNGKRYLVYLKEVPTKIAVGGAVESTTVRPFIRQLKEDVC